MPRRPLTPHAARVLLTAVALVGLAACSGGDPSATTIAADRTQVIRSLARDVIVPGQQQLAASTASLSEALAELCATPDATTFERARDAWGAAQGAWASTAAYRLGPIRPLRLTARIAYPVDVDKIDALADDAAAPAPVTPEALAASGADVRGLAAVEHLLFTPTDVGQLSARRCAYAASAAALSAEGADELLAAWVDGVDGDAPAVDQLANPGGDSMWASSTEALEDLLNASLSALTNVADMQLGPTTGETTGTPEAIEQGAAARGLADVVDELRSVRAVYGDSTTRPPTGLSALVAAAATSTSDEAIRTDLAGAVDAVDDSSLLEAYQHTLAARTALGTEVASLLGLTISFSDSDGDG